MGIGLFKNICEKIEGIQFLNKPIKCLRLYVVSDRTKFTTLNYDSKMKKIEKMIKSWKKRDLSIFGKITIKKLN